MSDCNWTRTHNHLVHKRTHNHLAHKRTLNHCIWTCCYIQAYSQMHRADEYSKHSSIIWPIWPNSLVFVYELSGCGFESSWSHLNFRFLVCFQQGVLWHSGNYRVWILSEMRTWHDKNIQSISGSIWFPSALHIAISASLYNSKTIQEKKDLSKNC